MGGVHCSVSVYQCTEHVIYYTFLVLNLCLSIEYVGGFIAKKLWHTIVAYKNTGGAVNINVYA